jgi:quinol monooxygenase YgiN
MLLLLAELAATPSTRGDLVAALEALARLAGTEPGCIAYTLHARQDDPCALVLYELYADRAACDAHLESAPVQSLLARFDSLLAAPPRISFCDTVTGHGRLFSA